MESVTEHPDVQQLVKEIVILQAEVKQFKAENVRLIKLLVRKNKAIEEIKEIIHKVLPLVPTKS